MFRTNFIIDLLSFLIHTLHSIKLFATVLFYCLEGSIKALLPSNILYKKDVKNQIILITGGGSGIGHIMAKQFGKLGAKIIIWDINKEECWYYIVDISKREEIYEAARKVKKDIGDVDILINNAGIVTGKKIFDSQDELMELTMAVNTISHFFTTKAFLPSMLERNSGHIVSIASLAGKFGVAGLADYCASKFGAIGFSESVAEEIISLKKDNVHVTTVCPYYIGTKMFEGVKTLSPNLLPILEPEYVVEKIIDAVLTNQEYLYMPKFSYFANILYAIFPVKATRVLAEYFGVNASIEDFIRKDDTN